MGRDDDRERTRSRLDALTRTNVTAEAKAGPPGGEPREPEIDVETDIAGDPHDGLASNDWSEIGAPSADSQPSWLDASPSERVPSWVPERMHGARLGLSRGGIAALLLVGLIAATGAGVFALRER